MYERWIKKLYRLIILKLKDVSVSDIKINFLNKTDSIKLFSSNKHSSGQKNYQYFIGCTDDDGPQTKSLYIILQQTIADAKCYDGKTKVS